MSDLKLALQQNAETGLITILSADQVPVIDMLTYYIKYVGMAVNFLRCGCPSVQMMHSYSGDELDQDRLRKMKSYFKKLELPDEKFYFLESFPIISVTRKTSKI